MERGAADRKFGEKEQSVLYMTLTPVQVTTRKNRMAKRKRMSLEWRLEEEGKHGRLYEGRLCGIVGSGEQQDMQGINRDGWWKQ